MNKRSRGRPKGPEKTELRVRVTPEVAEWLREHGVSKTVEALVKKAMKRKPSPD